MEEHPISISIALSIDIQSNTLRSTATYDFGAIFGEILFEIPNSIAIVSATDECGKQIEYKLTRTTDEESFRRLSIMKLEQRQTVAFVYTINTGTSYGIEIDSKSNCIRSCRGANWMPKISSDRVVRFKLDCTLANLNDNQLLQFKEAVLVSSIGHCKCVYHPSLRELKFTDFGAGLVTKQECFGFFIGPYSLIRINSSPDVCLWLPSDKQGITKVVANYITDSVGYLCWYLQPLELDRLVPNSLNVVFCTEIGDSSFDSLELVEKSLIEDEREIEQTMVFCELWPQIITRHFFSPLRLLCKDAHTENIICGFSQYLSNCMLKSFFGDSYLKSKIWHLARKVKSIEDDNGIERSASFYEEAKFDDAYWIKKYCLSWTMLDDKLLKSNLSLKNFAIFTLKKHNVFLQKCNSERIDYNNFLNFISQSADYDAVFLWWKQIECINHKMFSTFDVSYSFSRKKMAIEMEFAPMAKSVYSEARLPPFQGQLLIRTQEYNGNIYEYVITLLCDGNVQLFDLPVHSKVRKQHRRRKSGSKAAITSDDGNGAYLAPIKWLKIDANWSWYHAEFRIHHQHYMIINMALKEGHGDVRVQLEGLAYLEQAVDCPKAELFDCLSKLIQDRKVFYAARVYALRVFAQAGPEALDAYLSLFIRTCGGGNLSSQATGSEFILPIKTNDYSDLTQYFLQKGFITNLAKIPSSRNSATLPSATFQSIIIILQAYYDMLRFNDSSLASFSDSPLIATIIQGMSAIIDDLFTVLEENSASEHAGTPSDLPENIDDIIYSRSVAKSSQPAVPIMIDWKILLKVLNLTIEQIERYVTREHMLPSNQNIIMQEIIKGPWSVILKHSLIFTKCDPRLRSILDAAMNGIPGLFARYTNEKNNWSVRLVSFQMQLQYAYECILQGEYDSWKVILDALAAIEHFAFSACFRRNLMSTIVNNTIDLGKKSHSIIPDEFKEQLPVVFNALSCDGEMLKLLQHLNTHIDFIQHPKNQVRQVIRLTTHDTTITATKETSNIQHKSPVKLRFTIRSPL